MEGPTQQSLDANIRKYYFFHFFLNFQLWFPIWIIYLTEERGLTLAQVTLIDIPFWLCIVVLQIPAAAIADRWGRKPTLIAGGAAFGLAVTAFGLATSFWLILLSYFIWGVAFALLNGTESAFLYDSLKSLGREDEYARIYGRSWAIQTAAAMAGTLIGAPAAAATSLPFPIVCSGAIAALAAVVAFSFVEPPRLQRQVRITYGQIISESAAIVRRMPAIRYAIFFFGLIAVGSLAPIFFFQPFLREHDVGLGSLGIWQTPMRIAAILGALAAARIILALGERRTFLLMPISLIASFAVLALWDSVYAQIAFPLMNFVVIMSQPLVTDYVNRRVPSEQRATVLSLTNMMRSAVLIPSAPLLGLLADEASLRTSFAAGGIVIAVAGLPLLLLWLPLLGGRPKREYLAADAVSAGGGS